LHTVYRDDYYGLIEAIGTEATKEEVMYRELAKVISAGVDPFQYFDY